MYTKKTLIINRTGLHARPGTVFVREAKKFVSKIAVAKLDAQDKPIQSGDAKSLVKVMSMLLGKGTHIEISAEGEDETAAVDSLVALVDSGMDDL
jgi:phosphocarrier protein